MERTDIPASEQGTWQEFFGKHEGYSVQASFYECRRDFTMEELYQAFKDRFTYEVGAELARDEDE